MWLGTRCSTPGAQLNVGLFNSHNLEAISIAGACGFYGKAFLLMAGGYEFAGEVVSVLVEGQHLVGGEQDGVSALDTGGHQQAFSGVVGA